MTPALSRAVIEEWRVAKLTVTNKPKINYLMLLLSSMDGPLLKYIHVFRIMQTVQEKFVSKILPCAYILNAMAMAPNKRATIRILGAWGSFGNKYFYGING